MRTAIARLFTLSESRGKEAAGLAFASDQELAVYKVARPAREMMRAPAYRAFLNDAVGASQLSNVAFVGHSRLVTDGGRELNRNNQPVVSDGIVGVHNGIIVNHAALWEHYPDMRRLYEVDSEVIFALLRRELRSGANLAESMRRTFERLQGAASIAALFDDRDQLVLATNNGSLYYRTTQNTFIFASESYIVDQFVERYPAAFRGSQTEHVVPGAGVIVDLQSLSVDELRFAQGGAGSEYSSRTTPRSLRDQTAPDDLAAFKPRAARNVDVAQLSARFPYKSMKDSLRRCTRCVLPETMPFVDFDSQGLCFYCRRHDAVGPNTVHGREALEALVAPYRRRDGRPDCIVGVSGGRDSMYGLYYLKTVLKMNPVAYTYDWGMVTDLARRNVSRICGQLGIEHILVSADIPKKRAYIRMNVEAWLERPSLGTIPLFMAGDKAYFYYLNKVRAQLGVELAFLCENLLERTDFKTGFAGVPPVIHDKDHVYTLPLSDKVALAKFYGNEFLTNRRYLNSSVADTAKAFAFYYLIKRDYHNLYRYIEWDEETIERTLLGELGFELAEDTQSTWRIGDGTAPFYNYIYYAAAGMTENDTFRSNQIRHGVITRERALELVDRDNRPRFPSIQWYLQTIGIERSLEEVLEIIERIPKRYAPARHPETGRQTVVDMVG